jgi:hypothetical protein
VGFGVGRGVGVGVGAGAPATIATLTEPVSMPEVQSSWSRDSAGHV